jgi:hypothetical protein
MRSKAINCAMVMAFLTLQGCQPDAPAPSATPDPGEASAPVSLSKTSENGMLTVDPAIIDLCKEKEGIVASKVSWNATSAKTEGAQIWLQDSGQERKLWSAGGALESSTTGRWMRDGSTVILVNGENDEELARIAITARPCDNP